MFTSTLILVVAGIFIFLSALHIYWVLGGNWGIQAAMPEQYKENYFAPNNQVKMKMATLIVAIGLLIFAYIILTNKYFSDQLFSSQWTSRLTIAIGCIFIIRAIGDFKLFGLFKKKDNSLFSIKDSQIFVPLCIFLGLSCLYLGLT